MISEGVVDVVGVVFPVGFIVVYECFLFVGFGMFLGNEDGGEDGEMI